MDLPGESQDRGAHWRALFEDSGACVMLVNRDGMILVANTVAAAEAAEVKPEVLEGSAYLASLDPAVQTERLGYIREAFETGVPVVVDGMLHGIHHRTTYRAVPPDEQQGPAVLVVEHPHPAGKITGRAEGGDGAIHHQAQAQDDGPIATLTKREREVLQLIGNGLSTADIAKTLHRSVKTIEWHRVSLGNKLGVSNRVELARIAIRTGLTSLEDQPTVDAQA